MRFLEKLVLKQRGDHKLMINGINWSMLESSSTSEYNEMYYSVSKSLVLQPTIKHLMKETSPFCSSAQNLVKES